LDRNLIPAESDVFIRRGFFKLRFEVEAANGSQEANMVEANNGNDGNDDAHNGEQNNGGNAMDMDPKETNEGATSNNNGQGDSYENNGVDGMQLQAQQIEAIQIGSINVQLIPTGTPLSSQNLGKNNLFSKPLSHVENLVLNHKLSADFYADSTPRKSTSGLPQVGILAVGLLADWEELQVPAAVARPLADAQLCMHAHAG
jgi:hypothetical protein